MTTLVFLLEEPSAREMLKGILPKILPKTVVPEYKVFEGKQDLEKRLERILRFWCKPDCLFVVMRDKDSGDCRLTKKKIKNLCDRAGKQYALVRIACHELESFYLGDLAAVENGLGIGGLSKHQGNRLYRNPDHLECPSQELMKLTRNRYDKVSGSRAIAPHLSIIDNRSKSFNVLVSGIRNLIETTGIK